MTAHPTVSILLPVYNGEKYLLAALESIRRQTLADWELVVVDDGSTDGTAGILAGFAADARVRVLRQENRGLPAARNRGLREARGRYVAFLDADDTWRPAYLAKLAEALEGQPRAVLAFAGWQYLDADGHDLPQSIVVTAAQVGQLRADLDRRNSLVPASVVARRASLEACGGFDEALRSCEDWDLWLRLRPLGDFVAVAEVLVGYRTHAENMSDNIERMERERRKVVEKHFATAGHSLADAPRRQREANGYLYFLSALAHLREHNTTAATERLRQALALWPGLLHENEVYYELGCAFQQRGYRGTSIGLNVGESAALIHQLLHQALGLPAARGRTAWAQACLVLMQLALLTGDRAAARRFGLSALRWGAGQTRTTALRRLARASLPAHWLARRDRRLALARGS